MAYVCVMIPSYGGRAAADDQKRLLKGPATYNEGPICARAEITKEITSSATHVPQNDTAGKCSGHVQRWKKDSNVSSVDFYFREEMFLFADGLACASRRETFLASTELKEWSTGLLPTALV